MSAFQISHQTRTHNMTGNIEPFTVIPKEIETVTISTEVTKYVVNGASDK